MINIAIHGCQNSNLMGLKTLRRTTTKPPTISIYIYTCMYVQPGHLENYLGTVLLRMVA